MAEVMHEPDSVRSCLAALRDRGSATTTELIEATGLSRPTVVSVLARLRSDGWLAAVAGTAPAGRKGGRPAKRHTFDADRGVVVGIDVSTQFAQVQVADLSGRIIAEGQPGWESPNDDDPRLERLVDYVAATLAECGRSLGDVRTAGLGVAGIVTADKLLGSPTVRDWRNRAVGDELGELLGAPVVMDNDLVLAAAAEASIGAMADTHAGAYVLTWHHVSARVAIEGVVLRGRRNLAGEVGLLGSFSDITVPDGPFLEAVRTVAQDLTRLHTNPEDAAGRAALKQLITSMTPAVAALVLTIDPDVVVLGGALAEYADLIAGPLADSVAGFTTGYVLDATITGTELGASGVGLGALAAAFDRHPEHVYGIPEVPPPAITRLSSSAKPNHSQHPDHPKHPQNQRSLS